MASFLSGWDSGYNPTMIIQDELNGRDIINNENGDMRKSKFEKGDKVKLISRRYTNGPSNPRWGGRYGEIAGIITDSNGYTETQYTIDWDNGEQNSAYYDSDLELIQPQFMRRTIEEKSLVKVASKPEVYFDLDEEAKRLGATKKWTGKFAPSIEMVGTVLGIDEGYAMVDFEGGEALLDTSCLEPQKAPDQIKFLARFPNGTLEEFSDEKEVQKRMQELYKAQSIKVNDEIKVYNVDGFRSVKLKIDVSFT